MENEKTAFFERDGGIFPSPVELRPDARRYILLPAGFEVFETEEKCALNAIEKHKRAIEKLSDILLKDALVTVTVVL